MHFQELILKLQQYWHSKGCALVQPYDVEKGAGTFNPATFLRSLGPEPFNAAYVEPCRRPTDGRYGDNPIRMQHYYQFQVMMKPCPEDFQDLYLESLASIGIDYHQHDIRFVHDDWETAALGAWGLGWEVWLDGMEITQFTYFQQVAGIELKPITGEITYGLERLCMYLQQKDSVFDMQYNDVLTYGDMFHQNEVQFSRHNFELADTDLQFKLFDQYEAECGRMCKGAVPAPAADYLMKASHTFNILDARGAISVNERQGYVLRIRQMSMDIAKAWLENRESLGFPLCKSPAAGGAPVSGDESTSRPSTKPVLSVAEGLMVTHSTPLRVTPSTPLRVTGEGVPFDSAQGDSVKTDNSSTDSKPVTLSGVEGAGQDAQDERGGIKPIELTGRQPVLIEVGVEEMPAAVFKALERDLPGLWSKIIGPHKLNEEDIQFYYTPRRLTVSIRALDSYQPDQELELKGPPLNVAKDKDGNWTQAAIGYAKKNGIAMEDLSTRAFGKAEYLYARQVKKGRQTIDILSEAIPQFLSKIHWYKTMRWGAGEVTPFVRPVRWIAALIGEMVIPLEFAGVSSSNQSFGHRFLFPEAVKITADRSAYFQALDKAKVVADQNRRRDMISSGIQSLCATNNHTWVRDDDLLDHVTSLVEYPFPVIGHFEERFLEIPDQVLIAEMKEHQKYFALTGKDGKLANAFIAVSNMDCEDMAVVGQGYRNVVTSRFCDAEFFLKEDLKTTLEEKLPALKKVMFEASLGSVYQKSGRISTLTNWLTDELKMESAVADTALKIARLCKADLTTSMVFEFTELQGEVGAYYAIKEGLAPEVAEGIRGHYLPRGLDDILPEQDEAALVGIADRMDSMTGLFGVGKIPTGSSDPYALRRACLGIVTLIIHRSFRLDIKNLISQSIEVYKSQMPEFFDEGVVDKILDFFFARLRNYFHDKGKGVASASPGNGVAIASVGYEWDTIDSVMKAEASWHDITYLADRIRAMDTFRSREDFIDVATTFKRVSNILDKDIDGDYTADLFKDQSETDLDSALKETAAQVTAHLEKANYLEALTAIVPLRVKVGVLFDTVMVNDPDEAVKLNRQRLLAGVRSLVIQVADFSVIQ